MVSFPVVYLLTVLMTRISVAKHLKIRKILGILSFNSISFLLTGEFAWKELHVLAVV